MRTKTELDKSKDALRGLAVNVSLGHPIKIDRRQSLYDAAMWLARSNSALAFISGRLGRWLTPTFVAVETRELSAR